MKSPRDQEIVSWWGWEKEFCLLTSNHFFIEIFKDFFYLGFNEITRDQKIVSWWGWGKKISSSQDFFHNETTRLSHGGDGVREIFISSKIQIQRNP